MSASISGGISTSGFDMLMRAFGPKSSVFNGYWNLPEKTAEAFTEDGWYRTGDLGYFDRQARLRVTGRASTLIITEQGEKVQPDEVESAYAQAAEIRDVGVLQDDKKVVGLIVPETRNIESAGDVEEQVRQAVRREGERLPSYQRLTDAAITRKLLPRTRIGKIRRHELKDRWKEANHVSHLDPSVIAASMSREQLDQTHWAAWVGATRRNPATRLLSRLAKTVAIDPQRGVISSLAFGAAVPQRRQILVWFPEGRRSPDGELQPFKPGLGIL